MESTTSTATAWIQDAAKKGLILGFIHILIFLILFYALPEKLTGFSYLTVVLILNLSYTIYHGIALRKQNGGYLEFGAAFKYVFVLLTTNGIIGILFVALFLLIEPGYPQVMAQGQLDTSLYWAQKMGAPENSLDEMREKFDFQEIENRYSFSGLLFSFGVGVLFYALGALIAGLVVRKQKPETF